MAEEQLTRTIIGAFYYVFNELGFGFLEGVYVAALTKVLRRLRHTVERECTVRVWFEGEPIALQRLDMVVDKKVIVEVKATELTSPTRSEPPAFDLPNPLLPLTI